MNPLVARKAGQPSPDELYKERGYSSSGVTVLNLGEILVRPVRPFEEQRYQELMQEHHYLGSLPKISETLWYVALWGD